MARSSNIRLADGLDHVAKRLGKTNSLTPWAALRLLTDEAEKRRRRSRRRWARWSESWTP